MVCLLLPFYGIALLYNLYCCIVFVNVNKFFPFLFTRLQQRTELDKIRRVYNHICGSYFATFTHTRTFHSDVHTFSLLWVFLGPCLKPISPNIKMKRMVSSNAANLLSGTLLREVGDSHQRKAITCLKCCFAGSDCLSRSLSPICILCLCKCSRYKKKSQINRRSAMGTSYSDRS